MRNLSIIWAARLGRPLWPLQEGYPTYPREMDPTPLTVTCEKRFSDPIRLDNMGGSIRQRDIHEISTRYPQLIDKNPLLVEK